MIVIEDIKKSLQLTPLADESDKLLNEVHRFILSRVEQMKHMVLALELHHLHLPLPPTILQRLVIAAPSLTQKILLRQEDQHPRTPQFRQFRILLRVYLKVLEPSVGRVKKFQKLIFFIPNSLMHSTPPPTWS